MNKNQLYEALADRLSQYWQKDMELLEQDPQNWQLVRDIDHWLVQYQNDIRVSVAQYRRNCDRLRAIYEPEVKPRVEQSDMF